MNTHEYQAKTILKKYGVPIPDFTVITNITELEQAIINMNLQKAVLKVQIHAGGRGKAGGVKIAENREEILKLGQAMLGMKIVNNQTGKEGIVVQKVMVTTPIEIEKEYYIGAIIDRKIGQAILIISPEGGIEIEEVAAKTPEKVKTIPISLDGKLRQYQLFGIAKFMGWTGSQAKQGLEIVKSLAKAFADTDASLLEINPLVKTKDGQMLALDAKLSVDENALFRHPEIQEFFDPSQLTQNEAKAKEFDLAYVGLNGEIGCMVNGAGLAMATMDIIHHYGASPANFLDVGGGASKEKVAEGFKIILSDPNVKAILVNIFGGIMNCETLALGVIAAASEQKINVPLVVRMEGTHVEQGRKLLKESGLNIISANSFAEAAEKVVSAIKPVNK